jgi:hypothetical protein
MVYDSSGMHARVIEAFDSRSEEKAEIANFSMVFGTTILLPVQKRS